MFPFDDVIMELRHDEASYVVIAMVPCFTRSINLPGVAVLLMK